MSEVKQKALLYCRVSDPKQKTDGHGLESQEHRCRQYAQQNNWEVEKVFLDDVTGGGDFLKRPAMNELIDHLRRNSKTDYFVVFDDIKRFSRDVYFYWSLIFELEKYNATPKSPNFVFENTPEGRFQQSITVAAGEYERESNKRQIFQKMRARLESGYYVFGPPAGYKYKKSKAHGKILRRHEPMASVVAEAMEGFASGRFQTKQEVKYFLESAPAFPKTASGKIGNSAVHRILTNPLYAGYVGHKPWGVELCKGQHKGLISYETFCKVQERLSGRAHAPARKDINKEFPLRGAVACECGNLLTSCFSKGRNKHYPYYLCQNRDCTHYGLSIKREVLEGEFETLLKTLVPSKGLFTAARNMFKNLWDHQARLHHTKKEMLGRERLGIDHKIEKTLDRIIEADSPRVAKGLEQRIEKLEDKKRLLAEKIANVGRPLRPFDAMYRTAMMLLENPLKIWTLGRFEEKRAVIKLAFADRLIYVRNEGYRTPEFSLPFKMLGVFFAPKEAMVEVAGFEPASVSSSSKGLHA